MDVTSRFRTNVAEVKLDSDVYSVSVEKCTEI